MLRADTRQPFICIVERVILVIIMKSIITIIIVAVSNSRDNELIRAIQYCGTFVLNLTAGKQNSYSHIVSVDKLMVTTKFTEVLIVKCLDGSVCVALVGVHFVRCGFLCVI
jgi:hypothetical protein